MYFCPCAKHITLDLNVQVFFLNLFEGGKVQVGNDQEMSQSERNAHVKTRGGKKLN